MYLEYIKEVEGKDYVQNEAGFIAYRVHEKEFFITDMYIKKAFRGLGEGQALGKSVEKIAIEKECDYLTCNVHMMKDHDHHTRNVKCYIDFGFKIYSMNENSITLIKYLKGE